MSRGPRWGVAAGVAGLVAGVAVVGSPAAPASAAAPTSFHLTGSGFGHGVGMSQYGAKGQAAAGRSATQILTSYYTGTTVPALNDVLDIRVNLLNAVASMQLRPVAAVTGGGTMRLLVTTAAGVLTIGGTPSYTFRLTRLADGRISVARTLGAVTTTLAPATTVVVQWAGTRYLAGKATLLDLAGPGEALGDTSGRYRYGELIVTAGLRAVNVLRLHDEYLRGIAEMPSSWPAAALQAQAIAARTYAYRKVTAGLRSSCSCHVFDTTADQVFAGWVKESEPTWGLRWVAAVAATDSSSTTARVVTYAGAPIQAFFFSSSGGRTRGSDEAFMTALPYLKSMPDPWSKNPAINPAYALWSRDVTQAAMAQATGLPDVARLDYTIRAGSGTPATVTAVSSTGVRAVLDSDVFRSRLHLPSAALSRMSSRLSTADKYVAAVQLGPSVNATPTTVVLVNAADVTRFDRVVAAPLALARTAPVLLTDWGSLPAATAAELTRLHPTTALVIGPPGAIGPAVVADLTARGMTVQRLGGATRYDTAAQVARAMGGSRPAAVVVSAADADLPAAVAAAGPAARLGRPVLLTAPTGLPTVTRSALTALGTTSTTVVGTTTQVSAAVAALLPHPTRVAGADRYLTSSAVATYFAAAVGVTRVVLGSGEDAHLSDPLAEAVLGRLTLLTPSAALSSASAAWLRAHPTTGLVYVPGGTGSISLATVSSAVNA